MPRRRDSEENQEAGKWPQFTPAAPTPRCRDEANNRRRREDDTHQAPRQNRDPAKRSRSPVSEPWIKTPSPGAQKQIEDRGEFESANRFLIHCPREDEQAGAAGQ